MAESLNVVALISGGKDSFFSILHCIQNGHKVAALGNLYPPPPSPDASLETGTECVEVDEDDQEHDLNSFMFQTVGHTVIPLYEQALGIPLYRQQILGTAVQTGTSYSHADVRSSETTELKDETESLMPLLKRIMAEHPTVNALSTGAILSTYQRTRIESVALRLGLTPLAYLWKYPILPPGIQSSLLEDMQYVGLDARIVKVASGGLDESFLWNNVASSSTIRRIEKSMGRFGTDGDGGVLGEGGEFETLVVDGPANLFKGKIVIKSEDQKIIREGGGSAWLQLRSAELVMKPPTTTVQSNCRAPDLLEEKFEEVLGQLGEDKRTFEVPVVRQSKPSNSLFDVVSSKQNVTDLRDDTEYWSISAITKDERPINLEAHEVVAEIRHRLQASQLVPSDIITTVIILRSMEHFASINKVYGALFVEPNPPSRVTISCGSMLPNGINMVIHLKLHKPFSLPKKSLHVQSRSYWAPANIGPYSQAVSTPLSIPSISSQSSSNYPKPQAWAVNVAGQIPLIPHTMLLPATPKGTDSFENFRLQAVLSLQHLWRIGHETNVSWWTSCVAYLPQQPTTTQLIKKVSLLSQAWSHLHMSPRSPNTSCENSDAEEERDLWEEKHCAALQNRGGTKIENSLPCWDIIKADDSGRRDVTPPFFVAEVEELPRQSAVEWHANVGIANACSIEVLKAGYSRGKGVEEGQESSTVFQTIINDMLTHYVIMIPYSICSSDMGLDLARTVSEALKDSNVGVGYEYTSFASYIDVGLVLKPEIGKGNRILNAVGVVPCRTLWDGEGKRLAAVVLL